MSDRIDEYHGDEAKVLTTAEVERWQEFLGDGIQLRRTLATTRALEKLEEGLRLWHGTPPDERARLAIDKAGELWRSAVERAEKAEAERDEARADLRDERLTVDSLVGLRPERISVAKLDAARALVAELVAALEGLFVEYDYLCSEGSKYALRLGRVPDHACAECVPGGPIVDPGFRCREHAARAALAKAKGAANG